MKTIADHILDILQNSTRASSTLIEIIVEEDKNSDLYTVVIIDNGTGMSAEVMEKALTPFFTSRTTRKVGLGLPLLKQNAEMTGGFLALNSKQGEGTTVKAVFGLSHIDRPALGDISGVFLLASIGHPAVDFVYKHQTESGSYEISTVDLKQTLDGVSLSAGEVRQAILEMIENNLDEIEVTR